MDQIAPSLNSPPPSPLHSLGLYVVDYFIKAFVLYIFILIGYASMRVFLIVVDHGLNWLCRMFELEDQPDLEAGLSLHGQDDKKTLDRNKKVLLEAHGTNVARYCYDGCVICLEDFRHGESCRVLDSCNHIFHPECIYQWLEKNKTCPICRKSIDLDATTGNILCDSW